MMLLACSFLMMAYGAWWAAPKAKQEHSYWQVLKSYCESVYILRSLIKSNKEEHT